MCQLSHQQNMDIDWICSLTNLTENMSELLELKQNSSEGMALLHDFFLF